MCLGNKKNKAVKTFLFLWSLHFSGENRKKNCIVHHMAAFAVEKNEAARATGEAEKMEKDMG